MKPPPIRHPERTRIQPYVPGDIRQKLEAFCAATGRSESAVVTDSLRRRFEPLPDAERVTEELAQLNASIRELLRYLKREDRKPRAAGPLASEG